VMAAIRNILQAGPRMCRIYERRCRIFNTLGGPVSL